MAVSAMPRTVSPPLRAEADHLDPAVATAGASATVRPQADEVLTEDAGAWLHGTRKRSSSWAQRMAPTG
jgi:hypothetical protein